MDKAQKALSDFRNAPEAQQAALDALRKAEQQLAEQLSKLEEAERQLAQLEDLLKKLTAIIEQQQKVQFDTAKAEANLAYYATEGGEPGVSDPIVDALSDKVVVSRVLLRRGQRFGKEGRDAFVEKRKPDFSRFPRFP